jgi:hypothetical protein
MAKYVWCVFTEMHSRGNYFKDLREVCVDKKTATQRLRDQWAPLHCSHGKAHIERRPILGLKMKPKRRK